MGIDSGKWNKVTDPLNIHKGKAGKWADPLGIIARDPDTSAEEAARREAARQAQTDKTVQGINDLYDGQRRQQQISDYGADLVRFFREDADRQKVDADRNLKFSLARSGQTGGSVAVDANKTLGDEYTKAILEATRRSQAGMADLRQQDAQARTNLIAMAQQGLNMGSASQQALASMRANLDASSANARAQGLGDIFTSVALAKRSSEEAAARRRADRLYTQLYPGAVPLTYGGFR